MLGNGEIIPCDFLVVNSSAITGCISKITFIYDFVFEIDLFV